MKHPSNGAAIAVGALDVDAAAGAVDQYLGSWSGRKKREPLAVPTVSPPPERDITVLAASRSTTAVEATCRLPGRTADSGPALDVLREVLFRGALVEARYAAGLAFSRSFADRGGALTRLEGLYLDGATPGDVASHVDRVHAVSPADLSALLAPCVGHEAFTLIGANEPDALVAAGFEVHELDWYAKAGAIVEQLE